MTTTIPLHRRGRGRRRIRRVPPPPFRAQRAPTRALLLALLVALGAVVAAGVLVPVPTFAPARFLALDGPAAGGRAGVLVLLAPGLDGRVEPAAPIQLQVDGVPAGVPTAAEQPLGRLGAAQLGARYPLPPAVLAALPGEQYVVPASVSPGTELPPGTAGEASVQVGYRPLGAVFLGRGLEVAP